LNDLNDSDIDSVKYVENEACDN